MKKSDLTKIIKEMVNEVEGVERGRFAPASRRNSINTPEVKFAKAQSDFRLKWTSDALSVEDLTGRGFTIDKSDGFESATKSTSNSPTLITFKGKQYNLDELLALPDIQSKMQEVHDRYKKNIQDEKDNLKYADYGAYGQVSSKIKKDEEFVKKLQKYLKLSEQSGSGNTKVKALYTEFMNAINKIDSSLDHKVLAEVVADILKEEYGQHNYKPFLMSLSASLGISK